MQRKTSLSLFIVICAVLVPSIALAQFGNGGILSPQIPINEKEFKLDGKAIIGTVILKMVDRSGHVVATFNTGTNPEKAPIYAFPGYDFLVQLKLDNATVDSVNMTAFPSLGSINPVDGKGYDRRSLAVFDSRLQPLDIGPQRLFVGSLPVYNAERGDNAFFMHAVVRGKSHLKILIISISRDSRTTLQDSVPFVVRDGCTGPEAGDQLVDMARAGWEFTDFRQHKFLTAAATMPTMPTFNMDAGKTQVDKPRPDHERDAHQEESGAKLDLEGLDAKPVCIRLGNEDCSGVGKFSDGLPLEITWDAPFKVTVFSIRGGKEKEIFSRSYKSRFYKPLKLDPAAIYRVEVRDDAGKLVSTIRLEAK